MISWLVTISLAIVVVRIVWIEVKCGRKTKTALASTNEQIEAIKQSAVQTYRAKFGKDPTAPYPITDLPKTATKRT